MNDKRSFHSSGSVPLERDDYFHVETYQFDGDTPKCHVGISPRGSTLTDVSFICGIEAATRLRDELDRALLAVTDASFEEEVDV